jgi:hypothetical protein
LPSQPHAHTHIASNLQFCSSGSWAADFEKASAVLTFDDKGKSNRDAVLSALTALQATSSKGSLTEAKKSFVATVGALASWADEAGVSGAIKGL